MALKRIAVIGLLVLATALAVGCVQPRYARDAPTGPNRVQTGGAAPGTAGGDAEAGKQTFAAKCIACHVADGVPGAIGTFGPSLNGIGDPTRHPELVSGKANSPANLVLWLRNPLAEKPGTTMPNLGLSDSEARNLTAFLMTLR